MIIKLSGKWTGPHVHEHVFVGPDIDHLALAGVLHLGVEESSKFRIALRLGAMQTNGRVSILDVPIRKEDV